jgi:hypothetical protein
MAGPFRGTRRVNAVLLATVGTCVCVAAQSGAGPGTQGRAAAPTPRVRSTPENVVFGSFPIDRQPVARVRSGEVVRIDTLSHRGTTQQEDPVTFLGARGVKPDEILQDVRNVWAARAAHSQGGRGGGGGGHILTGPIFVEGAAPGDTLAVAML